MKGEEGIGEILIVVLIFAGFVGGLGYIWMQQDEQIENFESIETTVLASDVVKRTGGSDEGGPTYRPDITYEYSVNGQTYENSNVFPGPGGEAKGGSQDGEEWAEDIVSDHPKGKQVTAYYNPENPSEAFLLENRNWGVLLALVLVVLTGGIFAYGYLQDA